jgi:hypothetical protein
LPIFSEVLTMKLRFVLVEISTLCIREDILGDSSETTKSSAAEQMLRYAGAWKDQLDVDELKHQIYADRDRS